MSAAARAAALGLALLLAACASLPPGADLTAPPPYTVTPLAAPAACSGGFAARDLDHRIQWLGGRITNFDTIGSGLAAGDLDNDGDLDLVLANLARPGTVYWNDGALRFRAEPLATGAARGVNAIDFDGDGWLDLAFTHPAAPPSLWLNQGAAAAASGAAARDRFQRVARLGAGYVANAMGWADLDGDGDLDLVTGSYNSELPAVSAGFAIGGGVAYYENRGERLALTVLAPTAEALAVLLTDLDGDALLDIVVGNDYDHPDQVFLRDPAAEHGWRAAPLFRATATNTMSYDAGDVDNDGRPELFAADMKPYRRDPAVTYAWERITILPPPDDVQTNENVLLIPGGAAGAAAYGNDAPARGVDATGWTWSAKFGDLDSDGFLDLYAVNGMIDSLVFGHLPGDELVEENQALRNRGDGTFEPAPQWGLGSERSGRGMSMADLDGDGDLDVVVSNMRRPSQVFENRICGGSNLLVDLRQPGTRNTHAIGAQVTLTGEHRGAPLRLLREVRSQSGYLSGDPSRLHFGIPRGAALRRLQIRWPDGTLSAIPNPAAGTLISVTYPPEP